MATSAAAAASTLPYLVAAAPPPAPARRRGAHRIRAAAAAAEVEGAMDVVSEAELREKGFMGLRKTKLVCTVGPACVGALPALARGGMGVARVNLCHGGRGWHRAVMREVRRLNEEEGFCVSLMVDTEGSQLLVADHGGAASVKAEVCFLHFLVDLVPGIDVQGLFHIIAQQCPTPSNVHPRNIQFGILVVQI